MSEIRIDGAAGAKLAGVDLAVGSEPVPGASGGRDAAGGPAGGTGADEAPAETATARPQGAGAPGPVVGDGGLPR